MTKRQIDRLLGLKIPGPHSGAGTKSACARGYIGYARDAEYYLDRLSAIHLADALSRTPDHDPEWDGQPEPMLKKLEAWHAARVEDDWSLDHAGDLQPGDWQKMMEFYPGS